MCLALVGSCTDHSQRPLEFWAMGREGEAARELLTEFAQSHPDIPVHVQQIPWSAAHEKLLTAYAGNALPDVVQLGNTWIPEFAALTALDPLEAWLAGSNIPGDAYFEGIWATHATPAGRFGVPWYVDTRLVFYRKDLLNTAGISGVAATGTAWRADLRRLRDHYRQPPLSQSLLEWQLPVVFGLQHSADLLRERWSRGDFRSPAFAQAFASYVALFEERLTPAQGAGQTANLYQDFAAGTVTQFVSGPWSLGELAARLPAPLATAWDTAPMPAGPDGRFPGTSLAGGAGLCITRTSRRKPEAWRLIEFLSQPAQLLQFHRLTGDLPARRDAWELGELQHAPHLGAFWQQLHRVTPLPPIPEWERVAATIARYAEEAIRGTMSVDAALAQLDRDVDRILEKRRWLLEHEALGLPAPQATPADHRREAHRPLFAAEAQPYAELLTPRGADSR